MVLVAADTPEKAADEVLAVIGRSGELEPLAARDEPDPWLVAEELGLRGAYDAAEAFARAAPRTETETLPAYVRARRAAADAVRAALARAVAAQGDEAILAALAGVDVPGANVTEIQLLSMRCAALIRLRRHAEAFDAVAPLARAAETLGWWARAERLYFDQGREAYRLARWRAAVTGWEHQLRVVEKLGRPQGGVWNNLGIVYRRVGRYDEALAALERAAALKRAAGDRAGTLSTLGNIGNLYAALGDYARAVERNREMLELARELERPRSVFHGWSALSVLHKRLGNLTDSLACAERVREVAREIGDPELVLDAHVATSLIYKRVGRIREARDQIERALALVKPEADPLTAARIHINLGTLQARLGEPDAARGSYERALTLLEPTDERIAKATAIVNLGGLHAEAGRTDEAIELFERGRDLFVAMKARGRRANLLRNLGGVYRKRKEYERAAQELERALELAREVGSRQITVQVLRSRALVHLEQGQPREALASARAAIEEFKLLVGGLSDESAASAREAWFKLFATGIRASLALEDAGEACYFLESGRAGALLESLGGREWLQATVIDSPLRRAELAARRRERGAVRRYQRMLAKGARRELPAGRAAIDAARAELRGVIARIQREAKAGASLVYPAADGLEQLQERLRTGEVMVLYGVLPEQTLALVVSRKAARIVRLGPTEPIRATVAALRPDDPGRDTAATIASIAKRVVAPLDLDAGVTRLVVSPHGELSFVPFVLAVGAREVAYVPSGTTYGVLRAAGASRGAAVLALGDPDYDRLPGLPATRAEAEAIGDTVLLGKEATAAGLAEALATRKRWRAVHLACHARVDSERPMLSSLALTGGALTTLDIFRMPVPADLVVLSACETGRGKVLYSEGVVGFTRAFMFAGAPRVLVSLWKVDDEATRALMVKYYELWKPGTIAAATALRKAQEFVAAHEKWRRPYYWAAWQLWGLAD